MSTYLTMWTKVKELTPTERKDWIRAITPCTGLFIDFRGVRVIDSDLYEALLEMERS